MIIPFGIIKLMEFLSTNPTLDNGLSDYVTGFIWCGLISLAALIRAVFYTQHTYIGKLIYYKSGFGLVHHLSLDIYKRSSIVRKGSFSKKS